MVKKLAMVFLVVVALMAMAVPVFAQNGGILPERKTLSRW